MVLDAGQALAHGSVQGKPLAKTRERLADHPIVGIVNCQTDGGGTLSAMEVSPDGKYAAVTHLLGQFKRPTAHLALDWVNANALTILDLKRMEVLGTVRLDDRNRGAANPSALAWSQDGKLLVVTHAGTHELSVIDFPALVQAILNMPAPIEMPDDASPAEYAAREVDGVGYVGYFPSARRRVKLPEGDLGPRAVVVVGSVAYVANYFSDTLTAIDLASPGSDATSIPLHASEGKAAPKQVSREERLKSMSLERRGAQTG